MPQDTLKKLRADMEARLTELREDLHDTKGEVAMLVLTSNDRVLNGAQSVPDSGPPRTSGLNTYEPGTVITLHDGTKQYPNAPTGPVVNTVPNTTPAVPREYGVGAVVSFQGANWRVFVVGDGIFRCVRFDEDGDRLETPFLYPRDVVLVTPARDG